MTPLTGAHSRQARCPAHTAVHGMQSGRRSEEHDQTEYHSIYGGDDMQQKGVPTAHMLGKVTSSDHAHTTYTNPTLSNSQHRDCHAKAHGGEQEESVRHLRKTHVLR